MAVSKRPIKRSIASGACSMKLSKFRHWLQNKWLEHQAELEEYSLPMAYDSSEYFARYKYWLKREYRYQQGAK